MNTLKVVVNGNAYYILKTVFFSSNITSDLHLLQLADYVVDLRSDKIIKNRFGSNEYIVDRLLGI